MRNFFTRGIDCICDIMYPSQYKSDVELLPDPFPAQLERQKEIKSVYTGALKIRKLKIHFFCE